MNTIKKIFVPFIEGLEKMDYQTLEMALEKEGTKGYIGEINWKKDFPYIPDTCFTIARSESHLAISYHVRGLDLRSENIEDDGNIWEDSTCEFFVQKPGTDIYSNFEVNCVGALLNGNGADRHDRLRTDKESLKKIIRFSTLEKRVYDVKDEICTWGVAMLIPFEMIGVEPGNIPESLRGNFYKCGDKTAHPHFASWNPIDTENPDFHRPEFFGKLIFSE